MSTSRVRFSLDLPGMFAITDYIGIAQQAERYGFDEIHVCDDLMYRPAWPILTLIGAHTSRIRLGPALVSPRIVHPAYHAANLAVLDELTHGRAVCVIGRGAFFEWLGYGPPEKPLAMLREAVLLTRRLLCADRTPFHGKVFNATAELAFHFPAVRRDVPIFIGTFGPQTCRLAGEIADGFMTSCLNDPDYLRGLRGAMVEGATLSGRDPGALEVIVSPLCSIARDRAAAQMNARMLAAQVLPWLRPMTDAAGVSAEEIAAIGAAAARGDIAAAADMVPERASRFFLLSGTPADVIPQIEALIAAGATHVCFGGNLGPDRAAAVQLLGEEILPYFR